MMHPAVGNDAIGCDECGAWFHPKTQCIGLRRAIECILAEGGAGIRFIDAIFLMAHNLVGYLTKNLFLSYIYYS